MTATLVRRTRGLAFGLVTLLLAGAVQAQPMTADTVRAGQFDSGKMWTFDNPPLDYFAEAYDFRPDEAWFERARLGALRVPGCSASFVSPHGLVMTNHHCARGSISAVSQEGERLLDDGFYASSLEEERRIPNYYADRLIAIDDVTDEVYAALEGAETDAERASARQEAIEAIQQRIAEAAGGEEAGIVVQVIALYAGGQYSAYTFRRYPDVRLVMAPELQMGYYGGDSDNFTYPRYALDMSYYRVYDEDGEPLEVTHYFPFAEEGIEEGDAIFVIGNPGSTSRLFTVAQLEWRRDVQDAYVLALLGSRIEALQAYYDANPEEAERLGIRNQIFGLMNGQKLYTGRVRALEDPIIIARRADTQRQLQAAIEADPALQAEYGALFDRMAEIQAQKLELADRYGAFLALTSGNLSSALMRRALAARQYLTRQQEGAAEEAVAEAREQLLGVPDQPEALQTRLLAARLRDFQTYLGETPELVQEVPAESDPMTLAETIAEGSVLASAEATAEAVEQGTLAMSDPALQLAQGFWPLYQAYQSAIAGLNAQEQEVASQIGRARFAVSGTAIPPDATFSLRIADGRVQGYTYNGTVAPPYTTYYGLYDHYYSYGPGTEWELPARWLDPPETFDYATPVNFVSTADIIGGNSGSPVINQDLEAVGLIFDGNIESLAGDYIYITEGMRAVAVDTRGMVEALDEIYDADRLVLELTRGQMVPTEADADAVMSGN